MDDSAKYYAIVGQFTVKGTERRTPVQRAKALHFANTLVVTHSVRRIRGKMLVTKRQFICWYKMNEGRTKRQCLKLWKVALTKYSEKNKSGETLVALDMPTRLEGDVTCSRNRVIGKGGSPADAAEFKKALKGIQGTDDLMDHGKFKLGADSDDEDSNGEDDEEADEEGGERGGTRKR